jgi:hypothetical protein
LSDEDRSALQKEANLLEAASKQMDTDLARSATEMASASYTKVILVWQCRPKP